MPLENDSSREQLTREIRLIVPITEQISFFTYLLTHRVIQNPQFKHEKCFYDFLIDDRRI